MKSVENNEEIAYGIYAGYGALVYATPLLGGFIADRLIGYRKAMVLDKQPKEIICKYHSKHSRTK